ncbi:hypothetical protein HKT18_07965 [Flavobacterium sp. IMCC34852]|uniref:Uncharacterized protein n=1 Tax=Flavobacterium rivulicola TaxID=2732161 RepID=A0A7Y3R9S9_9FLAO|nr:hypothetical protein [Flavobacterium sp. IMCC34852]NNT72145.1 hypothetical protein [Flavobacterium sp. IMCC34852]
MEKAAKDFSQGYYYCESFGLKAEFDTEFTKFYDNYIKTKYGIIYGNGGCIVDDFRKCYSEKMENLIVEKFGKDIFERALKEAKDLYYEKKY